MNDWDSDDDHLDIDNLPSSWKGYTREAKVQKLVEIVDHYLKVVRQGKFNAVLAPRVSALCLEALMSLSDIYADIESDAKNSKYTLEYIESEIALNIKTAKLESKEKFSEISLKRESLVSKDVKDARDIMVQKEREYKKWRYIYEILQESHVFFRNLNKVLLGGT